MDNHKTYVMRTDPDGWLVVEEFDGGFFPLYCDEAACWVINDVDKETL